MGPATKQRDWSKVEPGWVSKKESGEPDSNRLLSEVLWPLTEVVDGATALVSVSSSVCKWWWSCVTPQEKTIRCNEGDEI